MQTANQRTTCPAAACSFNSAWWNASEKLKLEAKLERKLEYLEKLRDQLAEQRIDNLKK